MAVDPGKHQEAGVSHPAEEDRRSQENEERYDPGEVVRTVPGHIRSSEWSFITIGGLFIPRNSEKNCQE